MGDVTTWHHGLVARWWANFNLDGPEAEHFRPDVEAGEPALDVGCGNGRLLVPWVAAGLDVDGVDPSADMIAACRDAVAANAPGRSPLLAVQAVHELDLPRTYGAAVLCGSFGLGGTRAQDLEGLRRVRAHLRPGGVIALDYEVDETPRERWRRFRPRPADHTPPPPEERRRAPDGYAYSLRHHMLAMDADTGQMHRALEVWQWQGDDLVAHEVHELRINAYSGAEIVAALHEAGFVDVRTCGGYHGGPPAEMDQFVVYRATAP